MFFRKAGKYLGMLYIFYFSFFVVLYFSLFKEYGYANEVYNFHSIFSSFSQLNFLFPAIILLYFVDMVAVVRFLVDFSGKRASFGFYLFYIFSSVFGILFYALFFAAVYFPLKKLILDLKEVSLTEVPVLIAYTFIAIVILLLWKLTTYWKVKARLNYFVKSPGIRWLILPLNGFELKGFLKFLFFVSFVVAAPFVFFVFGVLNRSEFSVFVAVILSYLFFPFSKIYIYYLLADKKEV